ncbi:MAG: hypothetical protein LBH43_18990 [Treponema sp.]|jgi:tetratricopeptide (TPR) repeat protein|nr:hypothetical protein [Treponema sp.]
MGLTKSAAALFLITALVLPAAAQSRFLTSEIEKLEKESKSPGGKSEALKAMARLYQLSGNREKAIEAWLSAAYAGSAADYRAVINASRLLVSLGEYERADSELRKIPAGAGEPALEARLLIAGIWAFGRGDTRYLIPLASDSLFIPWRSEIYYTLWKTSQSHTLASGRAEDWKTRLLAEYPQSPEARISGMAAGNVRAAAAPLWLLSTGLSSGVSTEAQRPNIPQANSAATSSPLPTLSTGQAKVVFIQTGLFGMETNAKKEAERLVKAGFKAGLALRQVNGRNLWAVLVDGGTDSNNTLRALKSAGWPDAFPSAQ